MSEKIFRKNLTKQELKWEKMKETVEARRVKILDPHVGDVTFRKEDLDQHIMEKKQREQLEKEANIKEGQYMRKLDSQHQYSCHLDRQNRFKTSVNEVAFRQKCQLPQHRRDYDLYDPQKWKNERLVTFRDTSAQGPAAMLNLEGYKLENPEIEAERKRYQRTMLDIQTKENEKRRERENKIEELENEIELTVGNKAEDDHRRVAEMRRAEAVDCVRINAALIVDRAQHRQVFKNNEMKARQDEINYWVSGELLNEKPNKYDKKRRIHWRGLPRDAQLQNFTGLNKQINEKKEDRETKNQQDLKDIKNRKMSEVVALVADRNDRLNKLAYEKKIQAGNIQKMEEDRKKNAYLKKEMYGENQPTLKFWNQFGISGR